MTRASPYASLLPPTPCRWTRDEDGVEWLLPGCIGTAVKGPEHCTCDTPESRIEQALGLVTEQAAHIERLRQRLIDLRAGLQEALAEREVLRRRLRMIESANP